MDWSSSPQRQHRASAMDANATAPFMALERRLAFPGFPTRADQVRPTLAPAGKEWARIACSSKKAHGCGNHGEKLLEGITLYVRTDYPYLTTTLSVFLNEEARRSVESELNVVVPYGTVAAEGAVKVATEQDQLLVMFVAFTSPNSSKRTYYLVYDATDASLYMIPFIPDYIVCTYTTTPVPRFTGGAGSRDHELVLLARKLGPTRLNGLVCVCSPATRANEERNELESRSTGLWEVTPRLFPEVPYAFWPQQMFSSQGKLFWADFAQGLVYCNQLCDGEAFVKFDFISLPRGYMVRGLTESPTKRRTIACIGSTIYFVYIDHGGRPGDEILLKVWTLDTDRHTWKWKRHRGFPCPWKEIWRQIVDAGAAAGARDVDVEPQYPVVMPGGALCLYLQQQRRTRESDYICSLDMHSKRPLWLGPVRDHNSASFILPTSFLLVRNYDPPPSKRAHKRKLERSSASAMPTNKRKKENVQDMQACLGTRVTPAVSHQQGRN